MIERIAGVLVRFVAVVFVIGIITDALTPAGERKSFANLLTTISNVASGVRQ